MNTSFFSTRVLFLALLPNAITFGMIRDIQPINTDDISLRICKNLSERHQKKCYNNARLVCKALARKRPNWTFMPDSVEKQYDTMIEKHETIASSKFPILFTLTSENDFNAVKWITHTQNYSYGINLEGDSSCKISAPMFAIHNNNRDIASFLIEANKYYRPYDWQHYYDTITVPDSIEKCLSASHNRDFSFLLYLVAVFLDDANKLKHLYSEKIPTETGQKLLLYTCCHNDSLDCFDFLLTHDSPQEIIKNKRFKLLTMAFEDGQEEFAQKLLEKFYDLNELKLLMNFYDIFCDHYDDSTFHYAMNDIDRFVDTQTLKEKSIEQVQVPKTTQQEQSIKTKRTEINDDCIISIGIPVHITIEEDEENDNNYCAIQ
jgi:hypothetical protein